jgi:hypothetical protein
MLSVDKRVDDSQMRVPASMQMDLVQNLGACRFRYNIVNYDARCRGQVFLRTFRLKAFDTLALSIMYAAFQPHSQQQRSSRLHNLHESVTEIFHACS